MDWEGMIQPPSQSQHKILLGNIDDAPIEIAHATALPESEIRMIEKRLLPAHDTDECTPIDMDVAAMQATLDERVLSNRVNDRQRLSAMMMSLGATHPAEGPTLLDAPTHDGDESDITVYSGHLQMKLTSL